MANVLQVCQTLLFRKSVLIDVHIVQQFLMLNWMMDVATTLSKEESAGM